MSINLSKGQKISLSKEANGLNKVIVGLGWDAAKRGVFGSQYNIDCDASAIILDEKEKLIDCVYYGNTRSLDGKVRHTGDNLTGNGDGDDEQIIVSLSDMPSKVKKIMFVVNIYSCESRKQDFGMIKNAFIRLIDASTNQEICKYNLSDNYDGKTAMVFAEVYNHNNEWKFNAIGQGTTDTSISSMTRKYR